MHSKRTANAGIFSAAILAASTGLRDSLVQQLILRLMGQWKLIAQI